MTFSLTPQNGKKLQHRANFFLFFPGKARFFAATLVVAGFMLFSAGAQADLSALNAAESQQKRQSFIRAALSFQGTPYVRGGNTKAGIDCSGLVCQAGLQGAGIPLPRTVLSLEQYAEKIPESEREPGDLVFFNTTGRISHVGIYLGNGEFVHAASDGPRTGVIVSNLSESYWNRTYRFSARIFPAVEPERYSAPAAGQAGGTQGGSTGPSDGPFVLEPAAAPAPAADASPAYRLEAKGTVLWDFGFNGVFPVRGLTVSASAAWCKNLTVYPGVMAGFSWDNRHGTLSVPLCLFLGIPGGFSVFAGTQFFLHSGGEGSTEVFFPGLAGVSWTSRARQIGPLRLAFYQSMELSVIPKANGGEGILPGFFRLASGLTLVFEN